MKHNHTNWSKRSGNHLAKILAKKCIGRQYEVTEIRHRLLFEEEKVEKIYREMLMAGKMAKKKDKGYEYPKIGHDGPIAGYGRKLLAIAEY